MKPLYDGDTFEHEGFWFKVKFEADNDSGPPWSESDGHGPVREISRCMHDKPSKRPGERFLNNDPGDDRITLWAYDWKEACRLAKKDGWNTEPFDAPNRIERAVQADFDLLAGWVNDEWQYVGVIVTLMEHDDYEELVEYEGEEFSSRHSLWGVESCGDYASEVAKEIAGDIISNFQHALSENLLRELAAQREEIEARVWAERDMVTV